MLPVLYEFTFDTPLAQAILYLVAVGLVAYVFYSGYRGTPDVEGADGKVTPASSNAKLRRAATFGLVALVLARFGLYYALPSTAFLGGKDEGFPLHTYGLMLALGFLSAVAVASRTAEQEFPGPEGKLRREQILDLSFWVLLSGILGSKLLFILVNFKDYANKLSDVEALLGGGLVFQGGVLGAGLASYIWSRQPGVRWPFLRLADLAIPTVSLGGAFGRLGCFSAGCCWGISAPPSLRWAVHFPGAQVAKNLFGQLSQVASLAFGSQVKDPRWIVPATGRIFDGPVDGAVRISDWVAQHGTTVGLHPVQLYDACAHVCMFLFLMALRPYRRFHGQIFGMWLVLYAFQRTVVELFRGDAERGTLHGFLAEHGFNGLASKVSLEAWYNVSTAQFISIFVLGAGVALLVHGFRQVRSGWGGSLPHGVALSG